MSESRNAGEGDNNYEMWLAESDPDDVDYDMDGTRVTTDEDGSGNGESDDGSDSDGDDSDTDEEGDGSDEEDDHGGDEEDGNVSDRENNNGSENEDVADDEDSDHGGGQYQKRKGKKKKNNNANEDEEEIMERFEFEIEEAVSMFTDELPIRRNEMPYSGDEFEDPVIFRDRRIRRGKADRLALGSTFFTGVEFKEAILDYALLEGMNITQEKYEANRLSFICGMGGGCEWRVYCCYDKSLQVWQIKTTYPWHRCTPNGKCEMLKSPQICRIFLDKLRLNPDYMPKDIQNHIKETWKLVSTGNQCQSARLKALKLIDEEYAHQFAHIRGYAKEILLSNPGSTAVVDTIQNEEGKDVFQRFYVCFDIIKNSWKGSCRRIIGIDGTFLKVAVKGVLLSAVGHDANNQIYPLAWAVVKSESADNWAWFINLLKADLSLGDGENYVIMSDRGTGLLSAMKSELPGAEHRKCVKHIVENLKKNHSKNDQLKPLIWNLAWSYNEREYKKNLEKVRLCSMELYTEVLGEQPETWCRPFFKIGSFCEDVDNNSTESFNSTITKARTKAMIPMLETIRRQSMLRITKRHKKVNKHKGRYSEYVTDILAEEKVAVDRCVVFKGTHGMFEVHLDGNYESLNMHRRICSCGKWQISGIPCEHAYGACIDAGLEVEDHVSEMFSIGMWRYNYERATNPLRGSKYWMDSSYDLVIAPKEPVLPGKKKTTKKKKYPRIKGKFESPKKKKGKKQVLGRGGRIMHCSKCGQADHNAAGCPKYPKPTILKVRHCSNCGQVGHNKGKCKKPKASNNPRRSKKKARHEEVDLSSSQPQPSQREN